MPKFTLQNSNPITAMAFNSKGLVDPMVKVLVTLADKRVYIFGTDEAGAGFNTTTASGDTMKTTFVSGTGVDKTDTQIAVIPMGKA